MAGEGRLTPDEVRARVDSLLPHTPIVVALSGGADSAVLAWAVAESNRHARAVSVDHGLHGSAMLMDAARAVAAHLGLDHEIVPVTPRSASETDLRSVRLAALEAAAAPDEVVVTGHTRDDQAETVLGNILRGTGITGLGGIPHRRGRWLRPLLDVPRSVTRALATALGLPYADDPMNEDSGIRRNRLRRETIPTLAAEFNPSLSEALARLGKAAGDDERLLGRRAASVPIRRSVGAVLVPAASLSTLPGAIAARVARRALQEAGAPVDSDSITAVLAAVSGDRTTVSGGIDVVREGPWVVLVIGDAPSPDPIRLDPEGSVHWREWCFEASDRPLLGRYTTALEVERPLVVRGSRRGDRIALGDGTKSVGDALAEAGIPARRRPFWPVVESGGKIVWIPGVRAAPVGTGRRVTVRAVRR